MPIIDKNILKEWYRNLKKPPQEQFWGWLDSYWHKAEEITMDAIAGLVSALSKKADLVDGKVPEEQLPFTVSTSEVIALGKITTSTNTVQLAVHSSGNNTVRINGVIYNRAFPNSWNFTAVTDNIKILIIYALVVDGSMNFYLAEGAEAVEAIEPELPAGALIVRRIVVTTEGSWIDGDQAAGFKEKAEDAWASAVFPAIDADNWLKFTGQASSFMVSFRNPLAGVTIRVCGIYTNTDEALWPGKTFTIFNNTVGSVKLTRNTGTAPTALLLFPFSANTNLTLKSYQGAVVKVNNNQELEVIASTSSGSASFPEGGTDGQTLVKDSTAETGVKWYSGFLDKITTAVQTVAGMVEFLGNLKATRYFFNVDSAPDTAPMKLWTSGMALFFTNGSGVSKKLSFGSVFTYTPTANFAISEIKTALEAQGLIFNDSHIIIELGSNNFTCSIDIGASNPNVIFTVGKRGSGNIYFTSVRTLSSGSDAITIMNGAQSSMAKIEFSATTDYLTIRNL